MRMIGVLLLTMVLVGVIGCEKNSDFSAGIPRNPPSIIGVITTVALPDVLVEENPAESSGSAKASVRVTAETRILRHDGTVAGVSALHAGQRARVWFTGPVAESYPVQATGGVIVIDSGNIVAVQERHEAQLMAISGVVGSGIGERDGAEVIVVFVEEQTATIEQNVPNTLDGYPVVIDVIGNDTDENSFIDPSTLTISISSRIVSGEKSRVKPAALYNSGRVRVPPRLNAEV